MSLTLTVNLIRKTEPKLTVFHVQWKLRALHEVIIQKDGKSIACTVVRYTNCVILKEKSF
jgi:hypothetical protein